jgi:putative ABC transport system substrate-binding protein
MRKQFELLSELVPQTNILALIINPASPDAASETRDMEAAALTKGAQLQIVKAATEDEIDVAFARLTELHVGGLLIQTNPLFGGRLNQIATLASRDAIPAIYTYRAFADAGGLVSYGPSLSAMYHDAGVYAGRILNGARPADLPVQQPTTFQLVINLKTAKALGLTVPQSLFARADEVIE